MLATLTTLPGDLPQLDEANAHYTRGADGLVHVRLYLAPVGVPARQGWLLRDPSQSLAVAQPTAPGTATLAPASTTAIAPGTAPATAQPAGAAGHARPLAQATGQATAADTATALASATAPAPTATPPAPTGTGTPAPPSAAPPFWVQAAPDSAPGSTTTIAGEGGATLGIALASVGGATPAAVHAQLAGDIASYPAAAGSADYSVRQTVSGLDLRLILHSAPAGGTIAFNLASGADVTFVQDGRGITVQRTFQQCGGGPGDCQGTQVTEYRLGNPVAQDSSPDPARTTQAGPVQVALTAGISGTARLALTVDPAWLQDARRAFPVTLDLPVATASASDDSGVSGTLSSCAPDTPAVAGEVVVGAAGGCTYRGLLYFDPTRLLLRLPIQSATLHLVPLAGADPSGVTAAPNAPGPVYPTLPAPQPVTSPPPAGSATPVPLVPLIPIPLPAIQRGQLPSWSGAPAIDGTAPASPSSRNADGSVQWEVTDAVRQWAANRLTNTGLTLASATAPVGFASPLGASASSPADTPYLDIAYAAPNAPAAAAAGHAGAAPRAVLTPCTPATCSYNDQGANMFGLAGRVWAPSYCGSRGEDLAGLHACELGVEVGTVNALQAQYVRIFADIDCAGAQSHSYPLDPYWKARYSNVGRTGVIDAIHRALVAGLIPVVTLNPNDNCSTQPWSVWASFAYRLTQDLTTTDIPEAGWGANPPMYFELGNELNVPSAHPAFQPQATFTARFPGYFATGALDIYDYLGFYKPGWTRFHLLTGGVVQASTTPLTGDCSSYAYTLDTAMSGLLEALAEGVPRQYLGAAIHPYSDSTVSEDPASWPNLWGLPRYSNSPSDPFDPNATYTDTACSRLDTMIAYWRSQLDTLPSGGGQQQPVPLVFTEINFTSVASTPQDLPPDPNPAHDGRHVADLETVQYDTVRDSAYLADLFTWLYNHLTTDRLISTLALNPIRVLWYAGGDEKRSQNPQKAYYPTDRSVLPVMYKPYIGLYQSTPPGGNISARKSTGVLTCPSYWLPRTGAEAGSLNLDDLYRYLTIAPC